MNSLPNEIIYNIMIYCDEGLRYITLMSDKTFMEYLDLDEKALLFAVKFYMKDHKLLYKYPKSLALAHNYFVRNKVITNYVRSIYTDFNDIFEYAAHSKNKVILTETELNTLHPSKIIMLDLRTDYQNVNWIKYIMHDADTVFEMLLRCSSIYRGGYNFNLIPGETWDIIETKPKYSWLKVTRHNYTKSRTKLILNEETISQLKSYPDQLAEYLRLAEGYNNISRKDHKKILDSIIDLYECSSIYIRAVKWTNNKNDYSHNKFIDSLAIKYYNKYANNIDALKLLYNFMKNHNYHNDLTVKISKKLTENNASAHIQNYMGVSQFQIFLVALKSIDEQCTQYMMFHIIGIDEKSDYMKILAGNYHIYRKRYPSIHDKFDKYSDMFDQSNKMYETNKSNIIKCITSGEYSY